MNEERVALPDGRRLRAVVAGHGEPVVVLESGGGVCAPVWAPVFDGIAAGGRTVAYDRAGYVGSDPGPRPRTLDRLVADLHGLLDGLGVEGPAVLVGASFGAVVLRAFAAAHPGRVGALLLVDPTSTALVPPRILPVVRAAGTALAVAARFGWHRPLVRVAVGEGLRHVPPGPPRDILVRGLDDGRNWQAGDHEFREADPGMVRLRALEEAGLPPVPVTTVVGTRIDRGERRTRPAQLAFTRREMAAHPRGRFVGAQRSSHFVPWQEPELVVAEVRRLVEIVRDG